MHGTGQLTAATDRAGPFGREGTGDRPEVRVIPFDYAADFLLTGDPGNLVQDVINVSVEGVFVAVSIGYGLDAEPPEALQPVRRDGDLPDQLGDLTLDSLSADLLIGGFRLHPDLEPVVRGRGEAGQEPLDVPLELVGAPFQRLPASPPGFDFLLNVVDTSSGRELQNRPVHSLATLGAADGRRPFKMLPQPMVFMPRSTIRLQIEERSVGVRGRLHLTLQGYKVLGQGGRAEEEVRRLGRFDPPSLVPVYDHLTGRYRRGGEAGRPDLPNRRVVPFDYVATLPLDGRAGDPVEEEIPVNVDGGYVATAVSYSLAVGSEDRRVRVEGPAAVDSQGDAVPSPATVDLRTIRLRDVRPVEALFEGLRLHPAWLRIALGCDGRLTPALPREILPVGGNGDGTADLGSLFERLNRPESVSFLYSITDSGTGRELQNQPVHNVAGLGTADGRRPFRVLHRPMTFLPRSMIRVQVKQRRGRGTLYVVFQGYKIVAPGGGETAP